MQVWSACSKQQDKDNKGDVTYQNSVELEGGSAFLQALCSALQPGAEMKGISNATQPIPIDALVKDVNERLVGLIAPYKDRTQVTQLTGKLQYEIQRAPILKAAGSVQGVSRVVDQLQVEKKAKQY